MRILIIEDEILLANNMKEFLEKENFIVDSAQDGDDGFYKASLDIYDLILLDIMLPKRNGYEILKNLREEHHLTPILMLSAKSDLESKLTGFDIGADDYLTKPFAFKELLARTKALLKRNGKNNSDYCFKDLTLKPGQCKLFSSNSNQEILLGSKEYQLMEYLLLNATQILSKSQISDKVWGYETDVAYNNTEVYISFLRKKMNYLESGVEIKTIRGIGYCLN